MTERKNKKTNDAVQFYKCPFISPNLECLVGGSGSFECLDHKFHEVCDVKLEAKKGKFKYVMTVKLSKVKT